MSIRSDAGETLVSMPYRSRATESFNESELSSLVADAEAAWPGSGGPDRLALSALRLPDCFKQTTYPIH